MNHQRYTTTNKCKSKVLPEEVKNKVIVEGKTSPGTEYNSVYSTQES